MKIIANSYCEYFFTNNKISIIIINKYNNLFKLNIIFI